MQYAQEAGEEQTSRKSKINAAFLELVRLDKIWNKCHEYKDKGNLSKWNEQLDSAWAELGGSLNPKIKTEKSFIDTIKILNKLLVKYRRNRLAMNKILINKQMILKNIQDHQGKGTAYEDEDEDNWE